MRVHTTKCTICDFSRHAMAHAEVVDLTSSPEPEASSQVLQSFLPRKRKTHGAPSTAEDIAKRSKFAAYKTTSSTNSIAYDNAQYHISPYNQAAAYESARYYSSPYNQVVAYETPQDYVPSTFEPRYRVPIWTNTLQPSNCPGNARSHESREVPQSECDYRRHAHPHVSEAAAVTSKPGFRGFALQDLGLHAQKLADITPHLSKSVIKNQALALNGSFKYLNQDLRRPPELGKSHSDHVHSRNDITSAAQHKSTKQKTVLIDITDDTHEVEVLVAGDAPPLVRSSKHLPDTIARAPPARGGQNTYTDDENALLKRLKGVENRSWDEIVHYFPHRSRGSLQVHYSTKLKRTGSLVSSQPSSNSEAPIRPQPPTRPERIVRLGKAELRHTNSVPSDSDDPIPGRRRHTVRRAIVGSVASRPVPDADADADIDQIVPSIEPDIYTRRQSSNLRSLRSRELGMHGRRAWASSKFSPRPFLNHMSENGRLIGGFQGTSGDVITMDWSRDGRNIVAGSIAISDARSQQYNMGRNLLIGDMTTKTLHELPEHHIARPIIEGADNPNALHAMRESQDQRLFMSITAVEFASDSRRLYSCGTDRMLRQYTIDEGSGQTKCDFAIEHEAAVDLLSLHRRSGCSTGVVATATHTLSRSINVFACRDQGWDHQMSLSPLNQDSQELYPSAVRFGHGNAYQDLLLAGFSADTEKDNSGETCLWDIITGARLAVNAVTHNVFDIAWNPLPSSASVAFAVACNPAGIAVNKRTRSVIQCFAPKQDACKRVLVWECPAMDINDVVYCPYDDHLIAAGATDGKVYVWDQRFADRSQQPLLVLEHGESLNVLDDERPRELTDTGVRMLLWGPTRDRLFTGSSDGIVKIWNPYRCQADAHLNDLEVPRAQRSAIMAGTFDPDHQQLLVGTENGQINLFEIGHPAPDIAIESLFKFSMVSAPESSNRSKEDPLQAARDLLDNGEIVLRSCGAMLFRQAVQGPNYQGPYIAPSDEQVAATEAIYQQALQSFHQSMSLGATPEQKADAQRKLRQAQASIDDQHSRLDFARISKDKATAFQHDLRAKELERQNLEAAIGMRPSACQLDCKGLMTSSTDNEIDDSERSQSRIPDTLGRICASQAGPLDTVLPALQRLGLRARCSRCLRVAQMRDDSAAAICEVCDFACFRCARPAVVSADASKITCTSCQMSWEAGTLGYDLVGNLRDFSRTTKVASGSDESTDDMLEYYGSLWQDSND